MDAMWLLTGIGIGIALGVVGTWLVLTSRAKAGAESSARVGAAEVERARAEADAAVERARSEAERARSEATANIERATAEAERARQEVTLMRAAHQAATAEADADVSDARAAVAEVRAEMAAVQVALAEEKMRVQAALAERDAAQVAVKELTAAREQMALQFKALSAESLEKQIAQADAAAEARLKATEQIMVPVAETLRQFQERLTTVEKERVALHSDLTNQVANVRAMGEELRRETHSLTNALRKPQVRGAWGEMTLRRIVEMAGMVDHCDFAEQSSNLSDDGHLLRPDMTLQLARGKVIYIDSKAPLGAFLEAASAADEVSQIAAARQFSLNVKAHVDALGGKRYWRTGNLANPEFVVLFLPGDGFLAAALEHQPDLYEYALGKQVVIATPNTLIALLRTVAMAWREEALAENAREVARLGKELYGRLSTMGSYFEKLGKGLKTSVDAYNKAMGAMESRVLVTARKFVDLEVEVSTDLPVAGAVEETVRGLAAPELLGELIVDELEQSATSERALETSHLAPEDEHLRARPVDAAEEATHPEVTLLRRDHELLPEPALLDEHRRTGS